MHRKLTMVFGLVLALTACVIHPRVAVGDGILSALHHHRDCEAKQTVVRLPAQEIRIETASPRVVVGDLVSHRTRGFVGGGHPFATFGQTFAPVGQGPFVATFLPMGGLTFGGTTTSAGSPALDAVHAMERHTLEFTKQKAALKAEMDHVEGAYKRIHASLAAPGADGSSSLQKSLDDLTKRVSDVEKLLIIHDNILLKVAPK